MDVQKVLALHQQRNVLMVRLHQLADVQEKRALSRRERAEYETTEREATRLFETINDVGGAPDGRLLQGGMRRDEETTHLLAPDQSLRSWTREHGRGHDADADDFDQFSFGKIVRAAVSGDRRELNEHEHRAMAEGVDAAGGFLVGEELSSQIIDLARAAAVCFQAGALTLPMLTDTLNVPRLASGSSANWKAENDPVVDGDSVWERVQLKAKTVVVEQVMSRELFEDLTPEADLIIRGDIAKAIGLKLDLAILEGSGSGAEPRGIAETSGVNEVHVDGPGHGWDDLVKGDYAVRRNNGNPATAAIMHPREGEVYALFKDADGQPMRRPPAIEQLPFLTSTQIRTDRAPGTAANVYVGDFSTVLVGVRPSLQIRFQLLSERFSSNLQVGFLAWLRADVALARPEHMTKLTGVTPASP
jgi:HK97 family phage major capsid protein